MEADLDRDGKISFEEFTKMVENTDVSMSMTLGKCWRGLPRTDVIPFTIVFPGAGAHWFDMTIHSPESSTSPPLLDKFL